MHLHSFYCQRCSNSDTSYPGLHEFLNRHPNMSFCIACSYVSLPPSLSFFSVLQGFCCCLSSFSALFLITCVAHQGWSRDMTEGALSYMYIWEALENQRVKGMRGVQWASGIPAVRCRVRKHSASDAAVPKRTSWFGDAQWGGRCTAWVAGVTTLKRQPWVREHWVA